MKHQPYESWMLTKEALDSGEKEALESHLQRCERCRGLANALMETDSLLAAVPPVAPASGFVQRWQSRLQQERIVAHRRQTSWIFSAMSSLAAILLLPLVPQLLFLLISPEEFLLDSARFMMEWLAFMAFIAELSISLLNSLVSTVPAVWWMGLFISLAGFSGVIFLSLFRFAYQPYKKGVFR